MTVLIFVLTQKIGEWNLISCLIQRSRQICDTMGFLYRTSQLATVSRDPFPPDRYRPTIRLPALDSIRPLSITDALVRIPSVFLLFMCVLWKQEFCFSTGEYQGPYEETVIDTRPIIRSFKNHGFSSKLLTKLQAGYR